MSYMFFRLHKIWARFINKLKLFQPKSLGEKRLRRSSVNTIRERSKRSYECFEYKWDYRPLQPNVIVLCNPLTLEAVCTVSSHQLPSWEAL